MAKREPAAVILSVSCEGSGSLGLSRSRFRTRFCASLRKYSRSSCEAWEAVVASNLTPLPLASLNRGRDPQGSLGTVPWAGGTETAEGNWREREQIKIGETPYLASAGTLVPAGAPSCFPVTNIRHTLHLNRFATAAKQRGAIGAPHSAGYRSARLRLTLGVLDDED